MGGGNGSIAHWLHDQVYHLNIITIFVIITVSTTISRMTMTKELKALSEEIYRNIEEVKDEIRELR